MALKSFQEAGNLFKEQTMRFKDRSPIRMMNQIEWYISNSCKESKTCTNPGLRCRKVSPPSYCWGIIVPTIDATAMIIKRMIVNFREERKEKNVFFIFKGTSI